MSDHTIKPIFIFSLPRSGSTLLQRILGNHPKIHTVSEPWVLLPFLGIMTPLEIYTGYSHKNSTIAINEFIDHLPGGDDDFYYEIRCAILNMYQKICSKQKKTAKYFLDKTPRYHLILDRIHQTFPEAKIIILMRNPLSVVASMLLTRPVKTWNLYFYNVDLYQGLNNLIAFQKKHSESSLFVNYENLIENPNKVITKLYEYLEIEKPINDICLESNQYLTGQMGDSLDPLKENIFNLSSIDKWKTVINNPIRKFWCIHYIRWIGKDRLISMGYDMDVILESLYNVEVSINFTMFKDFYRIIFGVFYSIFEYTIIKNNIKRLAHIFQIYAKT